MSFASEWFDAPFTDEQVEAMHQYQQGEDAYVCLIDVCRARHGRSILVAQPYGLVCPHSECDYVVDGLPEHVVTGKFRR